MHRSISAPVLITAMLVIAGCGIHARYKKDEFGPRIQTSTDEAIENIQTMMSMDPQAMQRTVRKRHSEALRLGKELFHDPQTGNATLGQSCNSCHPNGGTTGGEAHIGARMGHGPYDLPIPSLIGAAAHFPKYKVPNDAVISLQQMNNNCIRMFMGGKRLPLDSPESYYLAMYVASLSRGEAVSVGEQGGR